MSNSVSIKAKKMLGGIMRTRTFPRVSWDLLGADKGGWELIPDVIVAAEVVNTLPTKGQAPQLEQVVVPTNEQSVVIEEKGPENEVNTDNTAIFNELCETLNKSIIKDYLDDRKIAYKNSMNLDALRLLLATNMKYNVSLFKKTFIS